MLDRRTFLYSGIAAAAVPAHDLAAENEAWRKSRLDRLKAEDGWLTLVGLHWLEAGANRIDSAPGLSFIRRGESVLMTADRAVMVNGKPTRKQALRRDEDRITIGDRSYVVIVRGDRVAIRERDKQARTRTLFKALEYYPFKPELRFEAKWRTYPVPAKRRVPTITNTVEEMIAPGRAEFVIGGQTYSLEPVIEGDHLFYIFKDRTAGKTTYGAGRYMALPMARDGNAIVDFNRAYNPPCAFTPYATCPLPLEQNRLPIPIEAGEKAYHLD
jgi:uncharacterized protein (DUF1684 family)